MSQELELRSYGDPCGIARALDAVGERWSLLIVRELAFGPKRFTDLKRGLAGASPNVLSQRLRDLEKHGVIVRPAQPVQGAAYELTDRGRELHPILLQLGRWGARSTVRRAGALSVDALMVALEATFVPAAAGDLRAVFDLRLDDDRFRVDVEGGAIAVSRGTPRKAHAVIETDPATLRAVVFGDRPLADAAVVLQGDKRVARTFFKLFARP